MYLKAVHAMNNNNQNNNKCMDENDGEKDAKWKDEWKENEEKNEWKDGKKDEKKEGTDLKKYILCKKVVDDNDVEEVCMPARNMVHKAKRDL